jgi:cation diffusion facilitator family transporter
LLFPHGHPFRFPSTKGEEIAYRSLSTPLAPSSQLVPEHRRKLALAKRVTAVGMAVGGSLSAAKLLVGWIEHSTAVFTDGLENAGGLFGSGLVLYALFIASRPPDREHPYGHGRSETIAGLAVEFLLGASGLAICYELLRRLYIRTEIPHLYAIWPMVASIVVKTGLSVGKFKYGRRIGSAALVADALHDGIEIISGLVALAALALTLYDPGHFAAADHWGGFTAGLIALFTAMHVVRDTSDELMDAMPNDERIGRIRQRALSASGASGVEKVYARKTGLQYHVELHLEVHPLMTVQDSHELATQVRYLVREKLDWLADVVVQVEPFRAQRQPS